MPSSSIRRCRRSLALCAAAIAASAFTSTDGLSASSRMSRAFSSASMACFIALSWPVRMPWSVTLLHFCLFLIGFNVLLSQARVYISCDIWLGAPRLAELTSDARVKSGAKNGPQGTRRKLVDRIYHLMPSSDGGNDLI